MHDNADSVKLVAVIRCRLFGHVPVWRDGVWGNDEYECKRCGRDIWFWKGQRTGFYTRPEPMSNVYQGVRWRRVIGYETAILGFAAALWWFGR